MRISTRLAPARLMLHLAMFTGLRLSDLAVVGRQHVKNGWLYHSPRQDEEVERRCRRNPRAARSAENN